MICGVIRDYISVDTFDFLSSAPWPETRTGRKTEEEEHEREMGWGGGELREEMEEERENEGRGGERGI